MSFRLRAVLLALGLAGCTAAVSVEAPVVSAAASPVIASASDARTAVMTVTSEQQMPMASLAEPVRLPAELRQGDLVIGRVLPGSTIHVLDHALRVANDGTFVFGLDRDATSPVVLAVVLPDGKSLHIERTVQAREYRIQKVTGIAERIMNPSAEDLRRINAENAQVAVARRANDDRLDFLQKFIWPAQGPITGVFGSQRFYNGVPKRPHYGVDVGVPTGTAVVAPAAGVVTLVHPDMFYSGGTLIIDHGYGVSSTMMHLSEVLVKVGDRVEQGQLVARSGASGRASGPHLDWRMNWFGARLDAERRVPSMPTMPNEKMSK